MSGSKPVDFDPQSFETSVTRNPGVALVDFWAPWCPPCRALAPTIDAVAATHAGSVTVGKINVDHNAELAARFGVSSIPTVILFAAGKEVERHVGVVDAQTLTASIDRARERAAA